MRPIALIALASIAPVSFAGAAQARPKLAVLVIFDQVPSFAVDRWSPFFGKDGFGGVDGARFDAFYAYADTETGPGHATLSTCANPDVHGIGSNIWYENGAKRYVVDDKDFPVLGAPAGAMGRGPSALLAPTLGDAMKADSNGRAKVVTLSLKDRAAILTAGRGADLAIWYDADQGRFTTSRAYANELPPWLADLGASLPAKTIASATWSPLPVPQGLEVLVPDDDRAGEGGHDGLTRTFPHDVKTAPEKDRKKLYRITPQSMDDLFTLALAAVDHMELGKDVEPDLLVVSVSTTDYVGHNYGPDSLEQLDTLRRADVALRKFVGELDARFAHDWVLAVTADHGSPPLPLAQDVANVKWPHGIVLEEDVTETAKSAADKALKDGAKRVLGFHPPEIVVDETGLSADDKRKLYDAIIAGVEALPGIARVYDVTRPGDVDPFEPLMRASVYPGRESPLVVRPKPRYVFIENKEKTGTDHGTPYTYDRRVPVWFRGPGVRRGRYAQPIDPRDIAPTLAFLLGAAPPDLCQGKPVPAVGD
jgi:predicted AlkP superfamily pyrophosphatase or phosphodiesterase